MAVDVSDRYPQTPDGRYFVVRGRLWRRSNPALSEDDRKTLVFELMAARRAVGKALRSGDAEVLEAARLRVDEAKRGLGERGPVWWDDCAPDYNRKMAANTLYADWHAALIASSGTTEIEDVAKPLSEPEPTP